MLWRSKNSRKKENQEKSGKRDYVPEVREKYLERGSE